MDLAKYVVLVQGVRGMRRLVLEFIHTCAEPEEETGADEPDS